MIKYTNPQGYNYYYIGNPNNNIEWSKKHYDDLLSQGRDEEAYHYANNFRFEDNNIQSNFIKTVNDNYTKAMELKSFIANANDETADKYEAIYYLRNKIKLNNLETSDNNDEYNSLITNLKDNKFIKDIQNFANGFFGESDQVKVHINTRDVKGKWLGAFEWIVPDDEIDINEFLKTELDITPEYLKNHNIKLESDNNGKYFVLNRDDYDLDLLMKLKKHDNITYIRNSAKDKETSDKVSDIFDSGGYLAAAASGATLGAVGGLGIASIPGAILGGLGGMLLYGVGKAAREATGLGEDVLEWMFSEASYYVEELQDTYNDITKIYDDKDSEKHAYGVTALYDYELNAITINELLANDDTKSQGNYLRKISTSAVTKLLSHENFNDLYISESNLDGDDTYYFHQVEDKDRKQDLYKILSSSKNSTVTILPIVRADGLMGAEITISAIQSEDTPISDRNKEVLKFRAFDENNSLFPELEYIKDTDLTIQGNIKKFKIDNYNEIYIGTNNEIYRQQKGIYTINDNIVDEETFKNTLTIDLASKQIGDSLAKDYINANGGFLANKEDEYIDMVRGASINVVNSIIQDGDFIELIKNIFGDKINLKDPKEIYKYIFQLKGVGDEISAEYYNQYYNQIPLSIINKLNLVYKASSNIDTRVSKYMN